MSSSITSEKRNGSSGFSSTCKKNYLDMNSAFSELGTLVTSKQKCVLEKYADFNKLCRISKVMFDTSNTQQEPTPLVWYTCTHCFCSYGEELLYVEKYPDRQLLIINLQPTCLYTVIYFSAE